MKKEISQKNIVHDTTELFLDESYNLIYRILRYANLGVSRIEFLREITKMLKNFSKCDLIEIRLKERDKYLCCKISKHQKKPRRIEIIPYLFNSQKEKTAFREQVYDLKRLSQDMMNEYFLPFHPYVSLKGSFWTCETNKIYELKTDKNQRGKVSKYFIDSTYVDVKSRTYRRFELTHKGFDLVVLSMTGSKAYKYKLMKFM